MLIYVVVISPSSPNLCSMVALQFPTAEFPWGYKVVHVQQQFLTIAVTHNDLSRNPSSSCQVCLSLFPSVSSELIASISLTCVLWFSVNQSETFHVRWYGSYELTELQLCFSALLDLLICEPLFSCTGLEQTFLMMCIFPSYTKPVKTEPADWVMFQRAFNETFFHHNLLHVLCSVWNQELMFVLFYYFYFINKAEVLLSYSIGFLVIMWTRSLAFKKDLLTIKYFFVNNDTLLKLKLETNKNRNSWCWLLTKSQYDPLFCSSLYSFWRVTKHSKKCSFLKHLTNKKKAKQF